MGNKIETPAYLTAYKFFVKLSCLMLKTAELFRPVFLDSFIKAGFNLFKSVSVLIYILNKIWVDLHHIKVLEVWINNPEDFIYISNRNFCFDWRSVDLMTNKFGKVQHLSVKSNSLPIWRTVVLKIVISEINISLDVIFIIILLYFLHLTCQKILK